ncbi:hypothetical protein CF326_g6842, partial [Tilletia indica]
MSIEDATAPQGWSLSAAEVYETARSSLSLLEASASLGYSFNAAKVRADFVDSARARHVTSLRYQQIVSAPEQIPDSLREEMRLIRSLVENWPDRANPSNERALLVPATPSGSAMAESSGPPRQGQIRAASPSSQEPNAKRAKLAISNEGPPQSAVLRFFHTPELLNIALGHLAFEKVDLITLSQVSKRLRANVLPLLVESLNVPLTKAGQLLEYLEANPGLAGHIKY